MCRRRLHGPEGHRFARSADRCLQLVSQRRWTGSPKLEHRLHQRHQVGIARDVESLDLWQRIRDGQVAQIDRDEVDALGYEATVDRAEVVALEVHDPVIDSEPTDELADAHVDRVHPAGAAIEQGGREAAGTRSDVSRYAVGDGHAKPIERVRELDVSPKARLALHSHRRISANARCAGSRRLGRRRAHVRP